MSGDAQSLRRALTGDDTLPPATDAYLATIVRASSDAILGLAGDGTIQSWNPAAERIFGYTPAEAVGRPIALLAPPGYDAEQQAIMSRLRAGEAASLETIRLAKDGRTIQVHISAAPVLDATGQLVLIAATLSDISARLRADQAQYLLASIVASSEDSIISIDLDGTITSWNHAAERLYGYPATEALGKPLTMLTLPEDLWQVLKNIESIRQGRGVEAFDTVRVHKQGQHLDLSVVLSAVKDATGRVIGVSTIARDITERLQGEADLRVSEEQYRTLFESIDTGFCVVEVLFDDHDQPRDYRFLEANPAFERQTGLSKGVGRRARELVPDLEDLWIERYGAVAVTGESMRFEEHSDAMQRWFDVYAFRVGQPEDRRVGILFTDITERKQAEQTLRESEARYRTLFQHFPNGSIFLFDHALRYTLAGGAGLAAVGMSQQQFEGKTLREIFPPEIVARDEPVLRAALAGVATRVEVPFGPATFVVDTLPVTDAQGTIVGGMVMTQDITERKRAEEERAHLLTAEQAARAEAEAALQVRNTFLSIASHELRTPLTALNGYAGMLRQRLASRQESDALTVRLADTLLRQVDRMNRLIGHLLDVSRLQYGQFGVDLEPLDLVALISQIVDDFRLTLPIDVSSHTIALSRPDDAVPVLGDPSRIEEVVQNLLTNAVKYSPAGGVVQVRVAHEDADAIVEVVDEGIGIPPAAQEHLFEPFYRAENVDRRTSGFGLGLYVVHEIVQGHRGTIVVTSTEGRGSTFRLTLPVHDRAT